MFNIIRRTILQDAPGVWWQSAGMNHWIPRAPWRPAVLLALWAGLAGAAAWGAEDRAARLSWWREARFGMFIHWGPVSLTGKEISWSRANSNPQSPNQGETPVEVYDNLYRQFNPTNFDAGVWAGIARDAGMKYVTLTAKHGDGFLLWDSQTDGYNIGATPFHRDICAELAPALRRAGLRVGWYFSEMDWRDPDCRSATHHDRFLARMRGELRELLSNYGKIDILWFDSDGRPAMWDPKNTYALVRSLQPGILINNRLEMGTQEQWLHQGALRPNEDFATPEQRIGAFDDRIPWETCMTLGTQWSWKPEDKIKTASEVIHILAQCAGGDGNLLLDVGPMPDGRIEPRQVEVLKEVGAWLGRNGESIYGTRGGPWKPNAATASTRQGHYIYAHLLRPDGETVELPGIGRRIKGAALLHGGVVEVAQTDEKISLHVPEAGRDALDTVVKLELDGSAMDLPARDAGREFEASASNVYGRDETSYGAGQAFDGDPETRWATDAGTRRAWIAVQLRKARRTTGVRIHEAYAGRVRRFEFQYRNGEVWKTLFTGTALGEDFARSFDPVTARGFRLNILDATDGPTIREIELLTN